MAWPFERANALGFAMYENFTSAQATLIDRNAAAAADGSIWSDLALVRNLMPEFVDTGVGTDLYGQALVWEPIDGLWYNFGTTAAARGCCRARYSGTGDWFATSLVTDVADTDWIIASAAAVDPNGGVLVGGSTSSGTKKLRRKAPGSTTWTGVNTVGGSAAFVTVAALCWVPSATCYVLGLSNTDANNIETSVAGIDGTWTQRTAPNTNARSAAAASATRVVVLSATNTNKCITSEDCITWTERTLPASQVWKTIAWSATRGLFMIGTDTGHIATSPDGITWTLVLNGTGPDGTGSIIRSYGRIWLQMGGNFFKASVDDGATWKILSAFNQPTGFTFAVGNNQVMYAQEDSSRTSLIGGL